MADDRHDAREGGSGRQLAAALAIVAMLGVAAGAGVGQMAKSTAPDSAPAGSSADVPHKDAARQPAYAAARPLEISKEQIVAIDPILVNLSGAQGRWVRLEASASFDGNGKEDRGSLLKLITEDLLGYLRSTSLSQIESPVGFELLRDDLSELARIRSRGAVKRLIIRSLVIE